MAGFETDYRFLEGGDITEQDVRWVLNLSAIGLLEWGVDSRSAALGSNVDRVIGLDTAVASNLSEVRVGFMPGDGSFNYLRLSDPDNRMFYVEQGVHPELASLSRRVLWLADIATRTTSTGRLNGRMLSCERCDQETGHLLLCDRPYGIAGAVMAGSEREECVACSMSHPVILPEPEPSPA